MWPFKKKNQENDRPKKAFNSVICIPGNWNSWDEFILLIVAANNGEYLAAGNILMNVKESTHCIIEFCDHDQRLKQSFKYAGMVSRVSDSFLDEIEKHKHIIYISGKTGNLKEAEQLSKAASAVIKAGGLGIKVETAGKAFEKEQWFNLVEDFKTANLYKMFVVDSIIDKEGAVYSCGMHNLGFRDTIISGEKFQTAVDLISVFSFYQIIDKPLIQNHQTFSKDAESTKYRITEEPNQPNKGTELFENPFGMWRLTRE